MCKSLLGFDGEKKRASTLQTTRERNSIGVHIYIYLYLYISFSILKGREKKLNLRKSLILIFKRRRAEAAAPTYVLGLINVRTKRDYKSSTHKMTP